MSVHTLWHRISPKLKKSLNYFFLWLSGHEISSKCTFIQRSRSKSRTKFLYAKCKEIKKTKFIANNLKLADWGWVTLFCNITQPHPKLASKMNGILGLWRWVQFYSHPRFLIVLMMGSCPLPPPYSP